MIVGEAFPGDNLALARAQHNVYNVHVVFLFRCAYERYAGAARLLGVSTELLRLLKPINAFDHRVLQFAHDQIAAFYRFVYDNGGQLALPFEGGQAVPADWQREAQQAWTQFYHHEVRQLVEEDNAITLAILTAVAYANTEPGNDAEGHLRTMLDWRYGDLRAKALERIERREGAST